MKNDFKAIIKDELKFLEEDFQYRCTQCDEAIIEYSNDKVVVMFSYDKNRSFEIECSFQLLQKKDQDFPFTLSELLLYHNASEKNLLSGIQVSDEDNLKPVIREISSYLKKYGQDILQGSKNAYTVLENFRNKESENYTDEVVLRPVIIKAERAWNEKNYLEFYKLLNPYKDKLNESDKKKLAFSFKKISAK